MSKESRIKMREEYKQLLGKKPYNGWDEEELRRRMDEYSENTRESELEKTEEPQEELIEGLEVKELETVNHVLDSLYRALRDGKHRRMVLDIRMKDIQGREDLNPELEVLLSKVYEGENKAFIKQFII